MSRFIDIYLMYTWEVPRENELILPGGLSQQLRCHLQLKTRERSGVERRPVMEGHQEKQGKWGKVCDRELSHCPLRW